MRRPRVLGLEGTAWNVSAALFEDNLLALAQHPYVPPSGGIHPREAAQHHANVIKAVVEKVIGDPSLIEGVAFSIGPGLGPCLRTVGTAARALALTLGVPLLGVNHCVAHVEIGRYATGCSDPVVLYVSGANTQVIGYLNGRYRIFGETLDIGLGNALDKLARGFGLPHPGGPQIERLAASGRYHVLPYTVKGMDLAFSGLLSAARGMDLPLEDICHSFQETAFAMCAEVAERALSQTVKDELLLVGGVGVNRRLQEMLGCMCEERGASFHVPDPTYMGDNGAMIAYTGQLMLRAGQVLEVASSAVNPSYRADQVVVGWRPDICAEGPQNQPGSWHGAEAVVTFRDGYAEKKRVPKKYREKSLDIRLIQERTRAEARLLSEARRAGVPTPVIRDILGDTLIMEFIKGVPLAACPHPAIVREAGEVVGMLHGAGIVHGDLTTRNIITRDGACTLIDFGLAHVSRETEARGTDIHVFFQTLKSTVQDSGELIAAFSEGYCTTFPDGRAVLIREEEIEERGRYL
jgi:N6-L-threonylcarbamoyladenine synthase/protein kinase Bud32